MSELSEDDLHRQIASMIGEDTLIDFVDAKNMNDEGADDPSRAFWRISDDGSPAVRTVIHTHTDTHIYIERYLQHCNPTPVIATRLSFDDAHAEWLEISAGTPTYLGSSHYVVE